MVGVCSTVVFVLSLILPSYARYQPNWESLDSRPLPTWFDEGKIGIFLHWGVFSVPSFGSEWFWWFWKGQPQLGYEIFMKENYRPGFTYADFAPMFKAEFFEPVKWVEIFKASGAKYVVLTSKHHEGFTNWPSKVSWNWNAMDTGPHRDLVGDLAAAIRNNTDIHFGLYHSLFEWFHPLYLQDKTNNYSTQTFVKEKTMPELYEIINTYKPDVLWSDGDWMVKDTYWNATQFLAWLYNDSPVKDTIVVNDRWGSNIRCKHGGFFNCGDKYNPGVLQKHKWENAMTVDKYSWGYRRNTRLIDFLTMDNLIQTLAETVSCGGNMLINVGPTAYGTISPLFEERLRDLGQWLGVNGEAIYSSIPWTAQNDTVTPGVWYTARKMSTETKVYAIVLDWPEKDTLTLGSVKPNSMTTVSLLGYAGKFDWTKGPTGSIVINIPPIPANQMPCKWAWVFRFDAL